MRGINVENYMSCDSEVVTLHNISMCVALRHIYLWIFFYLQEISNHKVNIMLIHQIINVNDEFIGSFHSKCVLKLLMAQEHFWFMISLVMRLLRSLALKQLLKWLEGWQDLKSVSSIGEGTWSLGDELIIEVTKIGLASL